jgi:hypothetical protein
VIPRLAVFMSLPSAQLLAYNRFEATKVPTAALEAG